MNKFYVFVFMLLIFNTSLFSQDTEVNKNNSASTIKKDEQKLSFSPTIGLGIGNFKFYGDILDKARGSVFVSNIAYDLHINQQLNNFLTAKFYVLFGRVNANERSPDRNLNFESKLTSGGFALVYNFGNFLPDSRTISPYVSVGIESIEFNSKTDLFDEFGNRYNYWSDGTIRNIAQNDPNAINAIEIERDYVYETDIREANFDGKENYSERTFAVPLGAGVILHATNQIDFTLGFTMHYTFSDLIDGVDENSSGERIGNQPGNGGDDKFLMSSISISYNFQKNNKKNNYQDFGTSIDYLSYDMSDEDADGVIDFIDECAWTPAGVEVDEKGCPLDKDNDLVPNYRDDEIDSRKNALVNPRGIELTDAMIEDAYLHYMDTSGIFAEVENKTINVGTKSSVKSKTYKVQVGAFTDAIDASLVDKFLGIPDVTIISYDDSVTIITAGSYSKLPDAVERKVQLTKEGFDAAIVVESNDNNKEIPVSVGDEANNKTKFSTGIIPINSQGLIFRVQIGAFSKRIPKKIFSKLDNIIELKADDGLYKYIYPTAFYDVKDAAKQKIELAISYGLKDAFIVAYKDGKRISLSEAGVVTSENESSIKNNSKSYSKLNISFKVQIGAYVNQLPSEVLSQFMALKGVEQTIINDELTRYTIGNLKTFKEAEDLKNELIEKGISGAFIIAFHGDELISVEKANELTRE